MKIFTSKEYGSEPVEVQSLPDGNFMLRQGYVKIQEENQKFATWCAVYFANEIRKFIYVPFSEMSKELCEQYKEKYLELYNKA